MRKLNIVHYHLHIAAIHSQIGLKIVCFFGSLHATMIMIHVLSDPHVRMTR
jgi:hypothetical protein